MKSIIQAMVVATLFIGTQANADDAMIVVPSQWTYADRAAPGGAADAFPGSSPEMIVLVSQSTHADRHAGGSAQVGAVAAFPGSAPEMIVLESRSTYADQFATGRNVQARAASDPALSQ